YIADSRMHLCPIWVKGEICVSGVGVGRGYLGDVEKTKQVFATDPFTEEKGVRLYKTGDLGCWLPDGTIEFFGRKDYQVKIRGFRIELGEIENRLLSHPVIKEAVVMDREDEMGNKYLCAYVVHQPYNSSEFGDLKEFLSENLPDYMLPAHFIQLDKMPLTSSGKVDRKALPNPEYDGNTQAFTAPSDTMEKKLVEIWADVLGKEKKIIGSTHNFFDLGGHSLKGIVLVAKIHKEFDVKLPMAELFKAPTIRELARYIKEAAEDKYTSIIPVEKKEYYPLSSAQMRFYILQQTNTGSTAYNMPIIIKLEGHLDMARVAEVFKKLLKRHESLRTGFEIVNEEPVQRVYDDVDFTVGYFEASELESKKLVGNFVKPFDLAHAPLLRLEFIKTSHNEYILMFDMHHIVTDGTSNGIFINDMLAFYVGKELPPLRLQYKDFSQWQHGLLKGERLKKQQEYWLDHFSGELPLLDMPGDYPRPPVQSYEGERINFQLDEELYVKLKSAMKKTGTTLYMMLLALYNVLISKYTWQKDIVVGSPVAGRNHADLENIIGLLIETIAIRNYPEGDKTFGEFLDEVKTNTLNAYENQVYPFREIIKQVADKDDPGRNPLFDTMLIVQNIDTRLEGQGIEELRIVPYEGGGSSKVSKVDFTLEATEGETEISFNLQYCTKLFKRETMEDFIGSFKKIISIVVDNKKIKLKDIQVAHDLVTATSGIYEDNESEFEF
ncbi:MAG: AMP-binding protein, partial [bacterium]|nr:AMP-binding protein [bacterium]